MGIKARGIDRLAPPHTLGSTHGGSRIIRKAYAEGSQYLPLLRRAYELWHALDEEWSEELVNLCGGLNIGHSESEFIRAAQHSAELMGSAHERMTAQCVRRTWPAFRVPDEFVALFDAEAGFLRPERCVAAHLALAERAGAAVDLGEAVVSWAPDGSGFRVVTSRRTHLADRLVLCAGAWIADLVPKLGPLLQIERVTNTWFQPRARIRDFEPDSCPVFMYEFEEGGLLYGVPNLGRGVKAGLHYSGKLIRHPRDIDRNISAADKAATSEALSRLLPDAVGVGTHAAVCLYTNTPDKHYFIDAPHPQVAVASACSGHGFKASSAVGETLAQLAAGLPPTVNIDAFRWRW